MATMDSGRVMKLTMRMSAPQPGQQSGESSWMRARRRAQRERVVSPDPWARAGGKGSPSTGGGPGWSAPTFVAVPVLLMAVAGLAAWIPARRAAKVDPATALQGGVISAAPV